MNAKYGPATLAESFVAVDVETANAAWNSICAVGAVAVQSGEIVQSFYTLVNPHARFDRFNIAIHGITKQAVADAPEFPDVWHAQLRHLFGNRTIAAHSAFDRGAFRRVFLKYGLAGHDDSQWLDTCRVARRQWPELPGHGLADVAEHLGIAFKHHNALEDARAAAGILIAACRQSSKGVAYWKRMTGPAVPRSGAGAALPAPNSSGPLFGERVVFTGRLSRARREVAALAAAAGCELLASVTTRTTMLVVGSQDRRLAAGAKSSKQRRAEELVRRGQRIAFLTEDELLSLCR